MVRYLGGNLARNGAPIRIVAAEIQRAICGPSGETSLNLPPFRIRGICRPVPIVQGGMGVGVSLAPLARAVSAEGGLGTVSSACLDRLVSCRLGRTVDSREAAAIEIAEAKSGRWPVAVNVMVALDSTYEDSVLGALDGGVDVIVSGAGLPLRLPALVAPHPRGPDVALVPIVSSGRALRIICRRWLKAGRLPDAVVLEGPLAGGHLGWKTAEEIQDPAQGLENILPDVLAVAEEFGGFPVIAAGGVYSHEDIVRMLSLGAAAVQMGTRFLATRESSASEEYKRVVVECTDDDILLASDPGSPCGLPFRTLKRSPMYRRSAAGLREARCDKGYVRRAGRCAAMDEPDRFFCVCNGLLSSAGYNSDREPALYTVGTCASRVDRILSVFELMTELRGAAPAPAPSDHAPTLRTVA